MRLDMFGKVHKMWRNPRLAGSKQGRVRLSSVIAVIIGALISLGARADSAALTILHSFGPTASSSVGAYPYGNLILASDGKFYGTGYSGGAHNNGTVYSLSAGGALTVVYNFGSNVSDGQYPRAGLVQASDGNLYGTTLEGGAGGSGTVFKLNPATGVLTTLYAFGTFYQDGIGPNSALVQGNDGYLYGTTQAGGANGSGTVYKISVAGTLTSLYSFGTVSGDGSVPTVGLVQGSDGNLYGATEQGGAHSKGTLFSITLAGVLKTLYSFGSNASDGATPRAGLIQASDGNYYGTTEFGGANGAGTVYEWTSAGMETVLYSFGASASDGAFPRAALVQGSDGNFYGTTQAGGTKNLGTVYAIASGITQTLTAGSTYTMPANTSVLVPSGTTVASPGSSTVTINGSGNTINTQAGAVVTVPASATGAANNTVTTGQAVAGSESILHNFGTVTDSNGANTDGVNPQVALVQGANGNFYGSTLNGGTYSTGSIFSITPAVAGQQSTLSTLQAFGSTGSPDGSNPSAGLLPGSNGNYYGTTQAGGLNSLGTVYSLTPAGALTTLYTFGTIGSDGGNPAAALVQGSDGNFYGTTLNGGDNGYGTVFQLTPAGVLTTLHSFGNTISEGSTPEGRLAVGKGGNFYGTTVGGGANFLGTIFRITPAGVLTTLYSFGTVATDGSNPAAGLVVASDGSFYGTTFSGGSGGKGTVFNITPSGSLTTLFGFSSSDGANPAAALLLSSDGTLYGTTVNGGANGQGAIFKVSATGSPSTLYSFGSVTSDGANPNAKLLLGSDGNLYGTTKAGGAYAKGTAFQITTDGKLTVLYSFGGTTTDGASPVAGLTEGAAGTFYGTTYSGGTNGTGTTFQLTVNQGGGSGGGAMFISPLLFLFYIGKRLRQGSGRRAARILRR